MQTRLAARAPIIIIILYEKLKLQFIVITYTIKLHNEYSQIFNKYQINIFAHSEIVLYQECF